MTRNELLLCSIYAILAGVALIAVWGNLIPFLLVPENQDLWQWVDALYANHVVAAFSNDLIVFGIVGCIFMLVESHRLRIQHVWVYILFSLLIAISVMFPIFLIVRQIALSRQRS